MSATQFGIDDDKPYCPVCDAAQNNEQEESCEKASLTDGVWET